MSYKFPCFILVNILYHVDDLFRGYSQKSVLHRTYKLISFTIFHVQQHPLNSGGSSNYVNKGLFFVEASDL